jgi:restriction system protein
MRPFNRRSTRYATPWVRGWAGAHTRASERYLAFVERGFGRALVAAAVLFGPITFWKAFGLMVLLGLVCPVALPMNIAMPLCLWAPVVVVVTFGLVRGIHPVFVVEHLLTAHANELGINKRRMVSSAGYGLADTKRWDAERARFATIVVAPHFAGASDLVDWDELDRAIDDVADDAIALLPKHRFDPDMDPFDYEHLCAELLVDAGWSAHATKASGDQGADVLAERNGALAVLQCKLYSSPVGNKAVQEVHAARGHYQSKWAVVVSNQTYTPSARELAQSLNVLLVHHDELARLSDLVRASS